MSNRAIRAEDPTDTTAAPSRSPEPSHRPQRFGFGKNWQRFLDVVDDERIAEARASLTAMLGTHTLAGLRFLDAGSGSGLSSLAALQLGAADVRSFDYDEESVACAMELKRLHAPEAGNWTIERADVLDSRYVESLGTFDVVYSWGVLHHTGDMYRAMAHVARAVVPGGRLYISIYNDQGRRSLRWRRIKRTFNRLPTFLRAPYVVVVMAPFEARAMVSSALRLKPMRYLRSWTHYKPNRGMSRWHDLVDWVGGYPFEVAKPEEVFEFFLGRGFSLHKLVTRQGLGCNEFVFARDR